MIAQQGFTRARVDGKILELHNNIELEKNKKHYIEILVDRLLITDKISQRLTESVELALSISDGILIVQKQSGADCFFSEKKYCSNCSISFEEIEPHDFSFNSPKGACSKCNGLGTLVSIDVNKLVPDINKSLIDGCIEPLGPQPSSDSYQGKVLKKLFSDHHLLFATPWKLLPKQINSF